GGDVSRASILPLFLNVITIIILFKLTRNDRCEHMKNIAIITDIHGNSPALRAVLKDISYRGVDHIYCLGDLVGIGPDSNEVIEMLLCQDNISFVKGNHDSAVVSAFYD